MHALDFGEELSTEHKNILIWANRQLARCNPPVPCLTVLSTPFRSGVLLINLIEVTYIQITANYNIFNSSLSLSLSLSLFLFTQQSVVQKKCPNVPFVEPKYLWHYMQNVTAAFGFLHSQTFEEFKGCTERGKLINPFFATSSSIKL